MLSQGDILIRLLLSVLVGGLIGAEREYRSKSAGFRTLTLICMGAALFTIFSELIGTKGTPDRIASNVVVGIGFVGAGVIFKYDYGVQGITTAAMIWVTAALGMGIGSGYYFISLSACGLILVVLFIFSLVEGWIDRTNRIRNYKIICVFDKQTLGRYEACLKNNHLKFRKSRELKDGDLLTGEWVAQGSEKNHRQFVDSILNDATVKTFEF
jgi:putative Mg2+ transporter-C (MgtC) family protein